MKRVLVTGGAGFIGSHLCTKLVQKGYEVTCFDNFVTGSVSNINDLTRNTNFSLVDNGGEFDEIYHLASPTDPASVNSNREMTVDINTNGTRKFIERAEKFLFVSSVKVHGNCPRVQPYIHGKKEGERICKEYGAKIARLASVYGPNMAYNDSRVVPTFIRRCLNNEPISFWNGGLQVDSFCYVNDIVDALILFMESNETGVVEFGFPTGVSILELGKMIHYLTNSNSQTITHENVLVVDECHKVVDISAAREMFEWQPRVGLTEGLTKTIGHMSRIRKEN